MKSYTALILAALAAAANAVQFTNSAINPEPGKPFELTWSGAQGPVTVLLKHGPSDNLKTVEELAVGVTDESLIITLDAADLPSDTYAFEIIDSADPTNPNYSTQFEFEGTGAPISASGVSSTPVSSATISSSQSSSSTASASRSSSTGSETGSTTTSSRPSRTSDADEVETSVPGAAGRVASPFALILVTVAAMVYFN